MGIGIDHHAGIPTPTSSTLNTRATGRGGREAIRCLKRYIVREIYSLITRPTPESDTQSQPSAA